MIGTTRAGTTSLSSLVDAHPDIGTTTPCCADPARPDAAGRVAAAAPGFRVVMVVRDPLERALAHWRHRVRAGVEERPAPRALLDPGSPYVACSRHHEALAPYRSSLAPEQQLVVVLERLRADPAAELDRVLRHVGVDPSRGPVPRRTRVPAPAGPTLDAATRAAFADAVGDDVAALRTWLDDALPEWA